MHLESSPRERRQESSDFREKILLGRIKKLKTSIKNQEALSRIDCTALKEALKFKKRHHLRGTKMTGLETQVQRKDQIIKD